MGAPEIDLLSVGEMEIDTEYYVMKVRNVNSTFQRTITWKVNGVVSEWSDMSHDELSRYLERNRSFITRVVHVDDAETA